MSLPPFALQKSERRGWASVWSIAAGTLLLVTTEFLPIGLLSSLAKDMRVSEGIAGLAVTAPGLVAALAAPMLTVLARGVDRRTVIVGMTVVIVASNLIAAMASSYGVFLVGRLVLGVAVGGLWASAIAVGRRLVPEAAGARATSIISIGISAGTVFGMPIGAVAGDWLGWRTVFGVNAAFGVVVVVAQLGSLPRLPTGTGIDGRQLRAFASMPLAKLGLIASAFAAAGHFIAYTFLEPYLRGTIGLGQTGVALALAGYAAAGILGAFAGERLAERDVRRGFAIACGAVGIATIAAALAPASAPAAIAMIVVWGFAFGAIPVCTQVWMFEACPRLYEAGSALVVSTFQIALAAGAAAGGVIVDSFGIVSAFVAGGAVCLAGTVVSLLGARAGSSPHRTDHSPT